MHSPVQCAQSHMIATSYCHLCAWQQLVCCCHCSSLACNTIYKIVLHSRRIKAASNMHSVLMPVHKGQRKQCYACTMASVNLLCTTGCLLRCLCVRETLTLTLILCLALNLILLLLWLQGSAAARPVLEQVLQSCQGTGKLHPMHVRIIDCHMPAANGCRRTGDNIGAIRHVTSMISAMEFYYQYPCIEVTNLYRFLVELYIDWASNAPSAKLASRPKRQAKEAFQKFAALQSICQGFANADGDLITKLKLL